MRIASLNSFVGTDVTKYLALGKENIQLFEGVAKKSNIDILLNHWITRVSASFLPMSVHRVQVMRYMLSRGIFTMRVYIEFIEEENGLWEMKSQYVRLLLRKIWLSFIIPLTYLLAQTNDSGILCLLEAVISKQHNIVCLFGMQRVDNHALYGNAEMLVLYCLSIESKENGIGVRKDAMYFVLENRNT